MSEPVLEEVELDDDDRESLRIINAVTSDQIMGYIAAFDHQLTCSLCGNSNWTAYGDDDKTPVPIKLNAYERGGAFGLAFALACDICGSLHMISAGAVAQWKPGFDDDE